MTFMYIILAVLMYLACGATFLRLMEDDASSTYLSIVPGAGVIFMVMVIVWPLFALLALLDYFDYFGYFNDKGFGKFPDDKAP